MFASTTICNGTCRIVNTTTLYSRNFSNQIGVPGATSDVRFMSSNKPNTVRFSTVSKAGPVNILIPASVSFLRQRWIWYRCPWTVGRFAGKTRALYVWLLHSLLWSTLFIFRSDSKLPWLRLRTLSWCCRMEVTHMSGLLVGWVKIYEAEEE